MKLVIEIDEETYKDIKKGKVYSSIRDVPQESVLAIANGIPLPKGHGKLIDADKFIDALFVYGQADDKFKLGELIKYTPSEIWEIEEMLAKTVIEADREVDDEAT